VDCDASVIVVTESWRNRIDVFSWADGGVRAQFNSSGDVPDRMKCFIGIRLLADGRGLVVADYWNDRLCVFTLSGEFVAAVGSGEQGLDHPFDVLECAPDDSFIVANRGSHNLVKLVKLSRDGAKVAVLGKKGGGDGEFNVPTALAALPDGGMVVREWNSARFQVFHGLELRKAWITMCVTLATREWRTSDTTKRVRV
jgi:hypothetical protein